MTRKYLITGASSGIGLEFAKILAQNKYDLLLVARREEILTNIKIQLESQYGVNIAIYACDLSRREETMAMLETAKQLGINGIINNAGFSIAREFSNSNLKEQNDFMEVCVNAPMIICHELLPQMQEQNFGRIINVSSIVAFANGAAGHTLYGAAKSFILKMSRSLAAENVGYNINILALCPGPTKSEFQNNNGMAAKMGKSHRIKPMDAQKVAQMAIKANESKKEVLVTGLINKISVLALKFLPEFIQNPLIRSAARKLLIK